MKLGYNDYAFLKWQMLHGLVMRRLLFGAFAFGSAFLLVSMIQMGYNLEQTEQIMWKFEKCPLNFENCSEFSNHGSPILRGIKLFHQESHCMVKTIFQQLIDNNMLNSNANVLSVGEGSMSAMLAMGELGFTSAYNVDCYSFFSFLRGRYVCEVNFSDGYFEFVFSRAVDKVSMPALLVLEIERVLRPGGIGIMLIGTWDLLPGNLISSVDAVSSYLKSSQVIDICAVGSYTLVVFEKRSQRVISFDQYQLPTNCPAITNNKPFFKFIEPLGDERKTTRFHRDYFSYLPKYMNITSRNKLVYINIGVEESTDMSVSNLVQPYRSIHSRNFNIYLIDHDISMLSSHVKNPGIVFIYHPGLSEDSVVPEASESSDEGMDSEDFDFDFIHWFKETVSENDFVVLRINANRVSYDILGDLFRSGAICSVDELFFHCPDIRTCKGAMCGDCMSLLKNLRDSGVFAHQWLGD